VSVGELVGKLVAPDSPWLFVFAVAVLVAAAGIGRRLFASITRQGARIGALENLARSEQTRRRQVEAELTELGIPLPYWPDDPHDPRELAVLRRRLRELQVPEPEDHDSRTSLENSRPPVPVPDDARHRR
jgi:hypothetical protein